MSHAAMAPEQFRVELVARGELSALVTAIRLRVLGERAFQWIPGQYVALSTDDAPHIELPFSIASAPSGAQPEEFDLAVSSAGSRELLAKLELGTRLFATAARGSFTFRAADGATLLIGIGTGLAPLRAMLQASLALRASDPMVLLFGARSEADILWRDELERVARNQRPFRFEPTLSRASAGWRGRRGRVQDHLAELVLPLRDVRAFLCGSKHMVNDCVARLTGELSVDPTRIWSEAF